MGLAEMNFDAIASSDIERLISEGTAEGIAIEYKRDMYGTSDGDKREYLKDVSSLANTFGGHLVIGLDEVGGVPTAITSIVKNGDLELQRLESLARDALEPRILGVRMRAIPHNGGYVFLIRVPRSWNGPHRVSFKGSTRFFGRTSSGAYELSVEELRSRFNASATAIERARELRKARTDVLAQNDGDLALASTDGILAVHLVPILDVEINSIDLERALELNEHFRPIGDITGYSPEFNFDGFANVRAEREGMTHGYTQIYRDGTIEAVKAGIVTEYNGVRRIGAVKFGNDVLRGVKKYLEGMKTLGVPTPVAVFVSLLNVRDALLAVTRNYDDEQRPFVRTDLLLPGVLVDEYGSEASYEMLVKRAFDALWNAAGYSGCNYYSDGRWSPPR